MLYQGVYFVRKANLLFKGFEAAMLNEWERTAQPQAAKFELLLEDTSSFCSRTKHRNKMNKL